MKLYELEAYINKNVEQLLKECAHFCKDQHVLALALDFNKDYKGCDSCIIYSSLDHLSLPTMSLRSTLGGEVEYVMLEDAVIEVLEDGVFIYPIEEFEDKVNDLREFGVISNEEARELINWVKSITKAKSKQSIQ